MSTAFQFSSIMIVHKVWLQKFSRKILKFLLESGFYPYNWSSLESSGVKYQKNLNLLDNEKSGRVGEKWL